MRLPPFSIDTMHQHTFDSSTSPDAGATGWPSTAFTRESGLIVSQANGDFPEIVRSAHAPGEHGISFMQTSLEHGVDSSGTSLHHMVFLTRKTEGRITTRIEGRSTTFVPQVGTLALIPEGAVCSSTGAGPMAAFVLMIPKETLAFAAAEQARAGASLVARLQGEDLVLLQLCRRLARHIDDGFVDGPLAWNELSNAVVQRLIDVHLSEPPKPLRGRLCPRSLARALECIHDNIEGDLSVDAIAEAAQQTWSHFPRLFRRSTGLSPHRYVIKVRLEKALSLLRSSDLSIAEVAAQTGFADQSHFCRWARRVYGATPSQMASMPT